MGADGFFQQGGAGALDAAEGVVIDDPWPGASSATGDTAQNGETIGDRLAALHDEMQLDPLLAGIGRVAAALYEPTRELVKTFIHATDGGNPLGSVAMPLAQTPMLRRILEEGKARVFDDIEATPGANGEVSRSLLRGGFHSRLVAPIIHQGAPFGVLFFNAHDRGYFTPQVLTALRPHMRAISMMLIHQRAMVRTMLAAVRTARTIGHHRDEETGEHLERMARYAQLIAERLAKSHGLSDEFIEYLFQYAPLHDIGKVAVPDAGRIRGDEGARRQGCRNYRPYAARHRLVGAALRRNLAKCRRRPSRSAGRVGLSFGSQRRRYLYGGAHHGGGRRF